MRETFRYKIEHFGMMTIEYNVVRLKLSIKEKTGLPGI
jgi:hypothetical protein